MYQIKIERFYSLLVNYNSLLLFFLFLIYSFFPKRFSSTYAFEMR